MRTSSSTVLPAFPAGIGVAGHGGRSQRLIAYAALLLLAVAWTLYAGKDVPWDALHYHLYAGFSALHDRFALDYFPAGSVGYLNPYAHVPLYLMVQAGWSSLPIGMVLAGVHATLPWLTWELARCISRRPDGSWPAAVPWVAALLALANPVLLQELGSSFNDITTAAVAMGGYVLLASVFNGGGPARVAWGGVLLGAAAALKLSNALFALVPALPLVLGAADTARARWRVLWLFAAGAGAGALLVGGPWAWRLWQGFGNPFFPTLDGLFHPDVPAAAGAAGPSSQGNGLLDLVEAFRDQRFLPSSLAEALVRPFDMLSARRRIHTEVMAADLRYVALLLLAALWLVLSVLSRHRAVRAGESPARDALPWLAASFLLAWVLWLAMSGNSRYFLPMACVAAVVLVAGLHRLLNGRPRAWGCALVLVLGGQAVLLWQAAELRWSAQRWTGPWIHAAVPEKLRAEPHLYLPMDGQSQSFLLPWLAPGASMLGSAGGYDSEPSTYGGRRARALIDANLTRLRTLKLVKAIESDGSPVPPDASTYDYPLRRLGLHVDTSDCDYIRYDGNPDVIERAGPKSGPRGIVYVHTCRVVPGGSLTAGETDGKQDADLVLDRVEQACPGLFGRWHRDSVRSGAIWRRNYPDFAIWVNDEGWVRFVDLLRGGGDITSLGSADEWAKAPRKLRCWRAGGRYHVERQSD